MKRALVALVIVATTATPVAAQQDDQVVRVDVRALSTALVPGHSVSLDVKARAVNTSTEPVRRLHVALRFGQPLLGRSAIATALDESRLGRRIGEQDVAEGELAPGGTGEVDFAVPLNELPFHTKKADAVYPMRIEVRSRFRVVGVADTYVMWWPNINPTLRIAWVWPLAEPSHRALGNDFYDDGLTASVDGGRLDALLDIGAKSKVPLTWAVDPELLDSLHRMTGPYTVRGDEGTDGPSAKNWLDRARAALKDATVLALPYGDPDLATTATGALATGAGRAFLAGRELLARDAGTAGDAHLAWPPGQALDPAVESLLTGEGAAGVVLPESALPLTEQLNHTPTAPTPLTSDALGSLTALVADAQLNGWVAEPTGTEGPRLAAQRFLADTAMTVLERPGDTSRDVVVTPPRTWEPVRAFATGLMNATKAAPWLLPVTLDEVLTDTPSDAARTLAPPAGPLLAAEHVRHVVDLRRRLQRLRGILTDPKRTPAELADLDDALLRAVSAEFAGTTNGVRLADSADAGIARQLEKLRVLTGGVVTMTGRSGRIPLTFQNDLGQAVRIRVRVDSTKRLRLDGKHTYEAKRGEEITIPPGGSTLVIRGKATTGGLFDIKVDLLGPDGQPLGVGTTLRVRSTAWGVVALSVTGIAFGLLLVASATRLLRRRHA